MAMRGQYISIIPKHPTIEQTGKGGRGYSSFRSQDDVKFLPRDGSYLAVFAPTYSRQFRFPLSNEPTELYIATLPTLKASYLATPTLKRYATGNRANGNPTLVSALSRCKGFSSFF